MRRRFHAVIAAAAHGKTDTTHEASVHEPRESAPEMESRKITEAATARSSQAGGKGTTVYRTRRTSVKTSRGVGGCWGSIICSKRGSLAVVSTPHPTRALSAVATVFFKLCGRDSSFSETVGVDEAVHEREDGARPDRSPHIIWRAERGRGGGLWVIRAGLKTVTEDERGKECRREGERAVGEIMEYRHLSVSGSTCGKKSGEGDEGEGR
ncbi:unnamed protein product [Pleuronectes platessa]|uniref:Uncharacterized protein n=1 Tax=Pleuronectes platessa TaxID=8262 RepID=A0A9N7UMB1_PLEPL|nr:unnamed protein product [Pleuronectes platessa]